MPPLGLMWAKMHDDGLPNTQPIDFRPSPFFQRSHSSALWAAVSPTRRYLRLMTAPLHDLDWVTCCGDQLNSRLRGDVRRTTLLTPSGLGSLGRSLTRRYYDRRADARWAFGPAALRAQPMKRSASGVSVRSLTVMSPTGAGG